VQDARIPALVRIEKQEAAAVDHVAINRESDSLRRHEIE
jgi:hypothetical protein